MTCSAQTQPAWLQDKLAADRYMRHVKAVLGTFLLTEGTIEQDQRENTDLVLVAASKRIAVRIRDASYFKHDAYRWEVTFRSARPSGTPTELEKMLDGWGDWFFYGFKGEGERLLAWVVLDLHQLRRRSLRRGWYADVSNIGLVRKPNRDNSSDFVAVDLRTIRECVIGSSPNHPINQAAE